MTKQELLDRLERIRDGFLDASDRHMIEGMAEDITTLMWDINKGGVKENDLPEWSALQRLPKKKEL